VSIPTPPPIFPLKMTGWVGAAEFAPPTTPTPPPQPPTARFGGEGFLTVTVRVLSLQPVTVPAPFSGAGQLNAIVNPMPQVARTPQFFSQGTLSATVTAQ
jgi:hypothetical protein